MLPTDLDKWEALDQVTPLDHNEKMLGLIAMMIGKYFGHSDMEEICTPWIDMSDAAIMTRARGSV